MKTDFRILAALALMAGPRIAASAESGYRPAAFYDTVQPSFPADAANLGLERGEARLLVEVSAAGTLGDWLVLSCSRPSFADSAAAALRQWRFEAASLDGKPISTTREITFHFKRTGFVVVEYSVAESSVLRADTGRDEGEAFRTYLVRDLDKAPRPELAAGPFYPPELKARGIRGSVILDYYIDESGQVRMPVVANEAAPELAALAVGAVRRWRFAPPIRHGVQVQVHVRQEFLFGEAASG